MSTTGAEAATGGTRAQQGTAGAIPAPARSERRERWVAAGAVGLLVTALLWLFSARQWALYRVPSWDLAIYTQMAKGWADGSRVAPILGPDFFVLGDHFNPHMILYAPLYALHPSGFTLLAAQAVLFGLTAAIVTFYAVKHLGRWGAVIGLASGLSYLVVEAHASQFHDIATAMPLLAMSMAMLLERRTRAALLWALPLLMVKEDQGLTVAAIGVVAALRTSSRRERWESFTVAGIGILAVVLVTQVVLPALNTDGIWRHAESSILTLAATDPGAALARLTTGLDVKLSMVVLPVLVAGIVVLRSPLLLVALPTVAWRLVSDSENHWGSAFHYGAVFAPIVFLALVDALPAVREWFVPNLRERVVPVVSAFTGVAALVLLPIHPLWTLTDSATWQSSAWAQAARAAEDRVTDGESVVTTITLLAYLAPRTEVMWYGTPGNPVPDAFVFNASPDLPDHGAVDTAQGQYPDRVWTEVFEHAPFTVARPE